ncbi:MAG TPA: DUF47 family protein [Myxococcota bacterium]|nr:DUF47 family protein [Myxococcota bacterium]HOA13838.1 DUF47 family protein [Myxococcota bacterium]HOC98509.1 DUF47 family protein [Myxococcota bacterium]HOH76941.1 DUF47 family protein [Myxococcota bacterium]HPV03072.1 DUF47 family protein [Myxococcota bacterium]
MLQKILPKNYGFFDLFENHAAAVLKAALVMDELLKELGTPNAISHVRRIEELEHECDNYTHMTVDLLRRTFITPLDREETSTLISALDDIADLIQAAAHRVEFYDINSCPDGVRQLNGVLMKAVEQLVQAVGFLREMKKHAAQIPVICMEINRLENEGDRVKRTGVGELFRSRMDPLELMKIKELYESLENAIDKCEDAANIVEGLLIQHVG